MHSLHVYTIRTTTSLSYNNVARTGLMDLLPQTALFPMAAVEKPRYEPQYLSDSALFVALHDVADEPAKDH